MSGKVEAYTTCAARRPEPTHNSPDRRLKLILLAD
jgi:hypothetical protein